MAMTVRAKYKCTHKDEDINGFKITLEPVVDGSAENKEFFKWTPYGKMEMGTINAKAAEEFVVGQEYYIDFNKAMKLE
jgi:hypothetical protein